MVTIKRNESEGIEEIVCPNCRETIIYEKSDVDILNNDSYGIYCPNCGAEVEIEKRNKISFPKDFYRFGMNSYCSHVTDKEIEEKVNRIKKELLNDSESNFYEWASGDTLIIAIKYEDCVSFYVAKNYYQSYYELE